jgi:hypothetical protein
MKSMGKQKSFSPLKPLEANILRLFVRFHSGKKESSSEKKIKSDVYVWKEFQSSPPSEASSHLLPRLSSEIEFQLRFSRITATQLPFAALHHLMHLLTIERLIDVVTVHSCLHGDRSINTISIIPHRQRPLFGWEEAQHETNCQHWFSTRPPTFAMFNNAFRHCQCQCIFHEVKNAKWKFHGETIASPSFEAHPTRHSTKEFSHRSFAFISRKRYLSNDKAEGGNVISEKQQAGNCRRCFAVHEAMLLRMKTRFFW